MRPVYRGFELRDEQKKVAEASEASVKHMFKLTKLDSLVAEFYLPKITLERLLDNFLTRSP